MQIEILIGLILFTLALLIYSVAAWAGVISKGIKKWHLILFWVGFAADIMGTFSIGSAHGGLVINSHTILGMIALASMLAQNIAATKIYQSKNEKWLTTFPKRVSLPIWGIWIASYIGGLILSGGGH